MKRIIMTLALIGLCGGAFAEDASPKKADTSWFKTWFEHLKQGLSESAVQNSYQKSRVTAVAAVRGAKQDSVDLDKPAWKGGAGAKKAAERKKERAEFAKAVDLILQGKTAEGLSALDAFEKAHPKSALLADVKQARDNAKAWQAQGAVPAPAAAAAAGGTTK